MKKKLMEKLVTGLLLFGLTEMVSASYVPIVNPSFEVDALSPAGYFIYSITGWTGSGGSFDKSGTWRTNTSYYPSGVPNGVNVAWSNGNTISQTTATALANNTTYTLSVEIGRRFDAWSNYTIELLAGSDVIASAYNPIDPGAGNFSLATLIYTAGQNDAYAGQSLGIAFVTTGPQVNFDAVSLNVQPVPIPAAIWLLGPALTGVIGFSRRKKVLTA